MFQSRGYILDPGGCLAYHVHMISQSKNDNLFLISLSKMKKKFRRWFGPFRLQYNILQVVNKGSGLGYPFLYVSFNLVGI